MSLSKVTKFFNRNEDSCLKILYLCNSQSLKEGVCIHSPIIKLGLQDNLFLNNNLLSLYAKCFGARQARYFFDEMPYRDVVSWTGILSAYVRNGDHDEALELFDSMVVSGHNPNQFTLSSVLRSCSALGQFDYGTRAHAYVIKFGFELNPLLCSALIDFYAKCDCSEESYSIFGDMDNGDTISWTTIISSLTQAQKWSLALKHYIDMINARVPPNEFTFVKLFAASCFLGMNYGKLLHAHLIMLGIRLSLILKTALIDMYSKFQMMDDAIKVSNQTPEYDVQLWTSVISGFTHVLKINEAIAALHEMKTFGFVPNNFTYSSILKACSTALSLELGKQIHSLVIMTGFEEDVCVGNALVDMYTKCSTLMEDALIVFRGITSPNVICWTSLIAGFAEHGFEQDSFECFVQMQAAGVRPNSFTLSATLRACSTVKSYTQTLKLHGYIMKTKSDCDIVVGNALVDAYAALGMVDDAWHVIRMMSHRDTITYTSLATRINQMGHHEMAQDVITHMNNDDIKMDGFSLASFLSASAALATLETGRQLHCYAFKSGLNSCISVLNALIDMYWKCGCASDAYRAFGEISDPDVVSWNGLISGLASNGYTSSAISAFEDMRLAGSKPDSVTLLFVLFACSRGGLVDMGLEYFQSMKEKYDVAPRLDHYVCLVDLLGRAGRLEDAMEVILNMPFKPHPLIYKTLLVACKLHKNLPLGEDMARKGIELDPSDQAFYLLLAKLYDDSGQSDLAMKTRRLMRERGLRTNPSQSWMELRNKVHTFIAGDRSHPQINEIQDKIESLITKFKHRGLHEDMEGSSYHSEKLALAFGLLNTPSNAPIRISKNKPICSECHDFIMLATKLVDREIIVRDGNRIHAFKKGECSCGGCY
ncbi:pentatricopeptide repeat-containing protein At5g52850, chloroplastic [Ziziphus jujuba]|uniref:Pentatricopeptide repeat-containing protein At5g52850, chloroplastic n=1 Tax=Ziziphus jujuba TaxID=326968 RepID=A0A6P3ZHY3_ZIZJJ|nr:pentatricopeptide repeat-containing protein At5g52850, chloroplastic [Ziziphus jujuba]